MDLTTSRRVVLVVLDGLRPDAIDAFELSHLLSLEAHGAWTHSATTVQPSVTAAAMGSLLTGVHPPQHGLTSDRFHIPRANASVVPLPAALRAAGFISSAFIGQPPLLFRRLARALAERLGIDRPSFSGHDAREITTAAIATIATQHNGFILVHLPDADRAGHAHGWMSAAYQDAAKQLDECVQLLSSAALCDEGTLFIACADHGGGGAIPKDHESTHPLDCTIPIIMNGDCVRAGELAPGGSILDIPATVLAALGVDQPVNYAGRPLREALSLEAALA